MPSSTSSAPLSRPSSVSAATRVLVNDVHSQLNATRVARLVRPACVESAAAEVDAARRQGLTVAIAGGRHAMGGQQFARDGLLVDTRSLARVAAFDRARGMIVVEGGIQWPQLMGYLWSVQADRAGTWGIVQKQTGADRLTLGGALSCNAHGRGLTLKPMVDQIEWFDLIGPDGELRRCSRREHRSLFALVVGGYGLFGLIARVALRLRRRVKVRRVVTIEDASTILARFDARIRDGFEYGDFQFAIDHRSGDFLRRGVCACYVPVADDVPLTPAPIRFTADEWRRLIRLAHTDKSRAFDEYAGRYLQTSGQVYWSDAQLAASYEEHYHTDLDRLRRDAIRGSEMITELYVPRERLAAFLGDAARLLVDRRADVIYGTVRLIERDEETVLAWARERWACVVLNLHVDHTPPAIARARETFRDLIDLAIAAGGSYYLTYHRWARRDQITRCYPRLGEFMDAKQAWDPEGVFQSTWWRSITAG